MMNEPHGVEIALEREVEWRDIAPLLDELQQHPDLISVHVHRGAFRVAAGGPGFDIVPILLYITASALVFETVRDLIYPKLKELVYSIYRRLPGITGSGKVYPMAVNTVEPTIETAYRLPEGLSDVALEEALRSISVHFAGLGREGQSLIFTYDADAKSWVENVEASQFETWIRQRQTEETDEPSGEIH
jgi:hypothetical protein